MTYKLVIFDFDGTLADSFPWFLQNINALADKYGFKRLSENEIETLRGYDTRQIIAYLGVPTWKLPLIGRYVRGKMAADIHRIRLFEGVDRMLRRLSESGVCIAIVSSNSVENVKRVLGPELAGLVSYYECGASIFGKATKFRRVLERSKIPRHQVISIGDECRDIQASKREQLATGSVTWGYATPAALRALAPTELFERVEDIEHLMISR